MSGVSPPPGLGSPAPPSAGAPGPASGTAPDPPPAFARLAVGTTVTGTVLGRDAAGLTSIKTDLGLLSVRTDSRLRVGARVALEIRAAGPASGTTRGGLLLTIRTASPAGGAMPDAAPPRPAGSPPATQGTALPSDWPALAEAAAALGRGRSGTPTAAGPLPQVGPRLAAGLAALIAAFTGGDLVRRLDAGLAAPLERIGRGELAGRVRQELARIAQLAATEAEDEWRLLSLPLLDGTELRRAKLYLRRRPDGSDQVPARDQGSRFILDIELSRLGPLQLDGLVRARRFDLVLRSRTPLPARMRRDIAGLFDEARAIGGFAGRVEFATTAAPPIDGRRGGDLFV